MKINTKILICVAVAIGYGYAARAQNIYGITGAIKTPSAYTVKSGSINIGGSYAFDYFRLSSSPKNTQIENWNMFANIGLHSRIEGGVRIISFPSVVVNSANYKGVYVDRNLSAKLVLVKEKKIIPQLSIGVQDAVGTKFFHASYITASKHIGFSGERMFIEPTIGYGFVLPSKVITVSDYTLKSFFGNLVFSPHKSIQILGEYDTKNTNIGARYSIKKFLNLQINYLNFKHIAGSIYLNFKL